MMSFCLLLVRRPPGVTRADTRFPATSHCRSVVYRDWLDTWLPGAHAGTFRGNQMAMAAGSAVMRYLVEHNLPAHASAMGDRLSEPLHVLQRDFAQLGDIRGRGLMLGVELVDPAGTPDAFGHPPVHAPLAPRLPRVCLNRGMILALGGRPG